MSGSGKNIAFARKLWTYALRRLSPNLIAALIEKTIASAAKNGSAAIGV